MLASTQMVHRSVRTLSTAIHHALALAPTVCASLFFVDDGEGDVVDVALPVEVEVEVVFAVLTKT
jgi:hypothetical protein